MSCALLAVTVHTSLYPILLLPPLLILLASTTAPNTYFLKSTVHLTACTTAIVLLAVINWILVGWEWIPQTWGVMYVSHTIWLEDR